MSIGLMAAAVTCTSAWPVPCSGSLVSPTTGGSPICSTRAALIARASLRLSLRRHPQRAVQADRLAVQHLVLGDVHGERGEFVWLAQPRRVRDSGAERLAVLLRQRCQERRVGGGPGGRAGPDGGARRGAGCGEGPAD